MKILIITLLTLISPQLGFSESTAAPQPTVMPYMEAWIKASTPREEHRLLGQFVGRWNHTVKWRMTPDAKPEESIGTTEVEAIMGGRFIRQTAKGTSMGQPFEGLGLIGFDNVQERFSTVWLDNMGTAMMVGSGVFDAHTKSIVDKGSFSCPLSETKSRTYRAVLTLPVKNSYHYEFFTLDEQGKEFKMMEILYNKAS